MRNDLFALLKAYTVEEEKILNGTYDIKAYRHKSFKIPMEQVFYPDDPYRIMRHKRFLEKPTHVHDFIEIAYQFSGKSLHKLNHSENLTLRQGELLFLNPRSVHAIAPCHSEDILVNFLLRPEYIQKIFMNYPIINVYTHFLLCPKDNIANEPNYLHFRLSDIKEVQNLCENIIESHIKAAEKDRNSLNIHLIDKYLSALLVVILQYTHRASMGNNCTPENRLILNMYIEMEQNYESISIYDFAKKYAYSVSTIRKIVKKNTGSTFERILRAKKFSAAAIMLEMTGLSIKQIADEIGYCNTSFFHRRFKEIYKVTPLEYRQMTKQKAHDKASKSRV